MKGQAKDREGHAKDTPESRAVKLIIANFQRHWILVQVALKCIGLYAHWKATPKLRG